VLAVDVGIGQDDSFAVAQIGRFSVLPMSTPTAEMRQ